MIGDAHLRLLWTGQRCGRSLQPAKGLSEHQNGVGKLESGLDHLPKGRVTVPGYVMMEI